MMYAVQMDHLVVLSTIGPRILRECSTAIFPNAGGHIGGSDGASVLRRYLCGDISRYSDWPEVRPLYTAVNRGRVDETDGLGRTALHRAAQGGRLVLVRTLISRGANVNKEDSVDTVPL